MIARRGDEFGRGGRVIGNLLDNLVRVENMIRNSYIINFCLLIILSVLASCISLSANVSGGAYTIEKLTVTDVWNEDYSPGAPRNEFYGNEKVIGIVETSGSDGIVMMRWFREDQLIYQLANKTQNNYFATELNPENDFYWLQPGEYRLEVGIGATPKFTEYFTIKEDNLERFEVVDPLPTPIGHIKQEGSDLVEISFAFDETWDIHGEEWELNEAKIVFLRTSNNPVLSFVFTEPNFVNAFKSQDEGKERTVDVAKYAKKEGYITTAEEISVGGVNYKYEHIFITFVEKGFSAEPKQGYRVQFAVTELE